MIATLAKVHHNVHEGGLVLVAAYVERGEVLGQDVLVKLALEGRELNADDKLALVGNVGKDVGLETTQHVRRQHLMESFHLLLAGDIRELLQKFFHIPGNNPGFISEETNT